MKYFSDLLQEFDIGLEYHNTLNPMLWLDNNLKPEVREKLLSFAYAWADYAKIPKDKIRDIIITRR